MVKYVLRLMEKAVSTLRLQVLQLVIQAEEKLPGKTGAEKKAYVVNKLDAMVKLPWYLEPFDGPAFSLLVDLVCDKLNILLGHVWSEANLTLDQIQKVATVVGVPKVKAEVALASVPKSDVDRRIEELYKQYGLK